MIENTTLLPSPILMLVCRPTSCSTSAVDASTAIGRLALYREKCGDPPWLFVGTRGDFLDRHYFRAGCSERLIPSCFCRQMFREPPWFRRKMLTRMDLGLPTNAREFGTSQKAKFV